MESRAEFTPERCAPLSSSSYFRGKAVPGERQEESHGRLNKITAVTSELHELFHQTKVGLLRALNPEVWPPCGGQNGFLAGLLYISVQGDAAKNNIECSAACRKSLHKSIFTKFLKEESYGRQ